MSETSLSKPMAGLRVADFTSMIAGPYCTRLLSDCGADVIKIEALTGDHMRHGQPRRDGRSSYFGHLNCGKRSIALDLKITEGQAAARDIAASCDVVVENYRPGVVARLGLDYKTLAARSPNIVYCSISGFGQEGPRAGQPAYAPVVHALSGYDLTQSHYQGEPEKPAKTGIFTADVMVAVYAFGAIQTALLSRARGGSGQYIDVALMDTMLNLLVYECQEAQFPVAEARPLYVPIRAKDGYVIVTPINDRNFEQLARAISREDWLDDPRFSDTDARRRNWNALMAQIEEWTSQHAADACETELMAVGVPCARYRTVAESMADPQVVERGLFATAQDGSGPFKVPNPPFRFASESVEVSPRVPELNGDAVEVLAEVAGYDPEMIAALRASGGCR